MGVSHTEGPGFAFTQVTIPEGPQPEDRRRVAEQPIVTDIGQGVGLTTPAPAVRTVKVLLSPLLQEGLEDFSIGVTEVPPHGEGRRHNHPHAAEVWLFFAGRGRAIVGDRAYPTGPAPSSTPRPAPTTSSSAPATNPSSSTSCTTPAAKRKPSWTPSSADRLLRLW